MNKFYMRLYQLRQKDGVMELQAFTKHQAFEIMLMWY